MPQVKSSQELFAGLFTEATPEGLPQGASPRSINTDYIVGSVGPRPGKRSAFTYSDVVFESSAGFTQSVGDGAPWSGGSVTLNQGSGSVNPVLWQPLFSIIGNPDADSIQYQRTPFQPDINGPSVMLLPAWMAAAVAGGHSGDDAEIVSITDDGGGSWHLLQSKVSFSQSDPSAPDPALLKSFQFWAGYFPNGFPQGVKITITFNMSVTSGTDLASFQPNGASVAIFGVFENCTSVFDFAFQKFAPTSNQFNGVPITTAEDGVIVTISNLPNPGSVTGGFAVYVRGSDPNPGLANLSGAIHTGGSPTYVQPAGTYSPQWGYGSPPVLPFQDTLVMTMALRPATACAPFTHEYYSPGGGSGGVGPAPFFTRPFTFTVLGAGDYILVGIQTQNGAAVPTISDTGGNSWNQIVFNGGFVLWYAVALAPGLITISLNSDVNTNCQFFFFGVQPSALGLLETLTASGNGTGTAADVNIGNLTSAINVASVPVSWNNGIMAFNGSIHSSMWAFVGDASSHLVDLSTADWTEEFFTGGSNIRMKVYWYSGATSPFNCSSTPNISQTLEALNFHLNIPVDIPEQGQVAAGCGESYHFVTPPSTLPIFGIEVLLTGSQSDLSEDAELLVQLQLPDGTLSPDIKTAQLPLASPGTITLGGTADLWGFAADVINAALLDNPSFQVNIVAQAPGGETVTFTVTAEVLVVSTSVSPPPDINYLKTFKQTGGELNGLFLGSDGVLYLEDSINAPDVLSPLFTRIYKNNFAQSATLDDREYIAFSNLVNGTDIPRVYSPPNLDRLSQVGPGAPASAIGSTAGGVINIVSITQPTQKSDPEAPGQLSGVLWSSGPGSTAPGNVITVYYGRSNPPGPLSAGDPDLVVGSGVFVFVDGSQPNGQFNGQIIDGDYIITGVGEGVPPGAQFGRWYFTVQAPVTQYVNQADHIEGNGPVGFYQVETATVTTASQVPNLEVGGSMQISGTGGSPPAGYDGTWLVTVALNAAQLQITATERTANQATYSYILISGSNPTVGQQITVGGTLNGAGVFNVQNVSITATAPGQFSISLPGADVSAAAENGTGVIFGTMFKFEPNKVVGTKNVGQVTVAGIFSDGIRKVCYSFLTRNGFMTQPSPIFTALITIGSTGITVSGLAPGPSNVIARVVHLTGANGGKFFNIPDPVTIIDPITGLTRIESSTWVMDNTSTSATFTFSDVTLLAADEIDIQGNNLFACYELGSCQQLVPYAQRLAAVGEQNKVFNFRNYSFDGGVGGQSSGQTYPLGWTVDGTNGAGGSVVVSPIFGWAYQIANATGGPQAIYGMITQPAYKDEFMVDIINASTTYSVRVTAAVAAAVASGNLVIDLFSASLARVLGSFTLPLNTLTTDMQLLSGTLLTTALAPVPNDLLIRIYATDIPDGATVILDREEVFPTEQPNLDTQVIFSYGDNFESFDRITGVIKPSQNSQPIKSCFVQFDAFYMVKTNSTLSTTDNGTTEPVVAGGGWNIRTVSQSVGTTSIYGTTTAIDEPNSGEDWAIVAGRAGMYIYDGGEPVKLSEEIQSIVNQINWEFGHTCWVLNDIINRRVLWGVPLKTFWRDAKGNVTRGTWLPEGVIPDDEFPETPNVVLELNYKQLNTASALASSVGVHRSYSGKLLASEITRKWALWTIKAPAAAFLQRADGSAPVFVGNSDHNGKIFQLIEGLLEDDGSPFSERYVTSSFLPNQDGQAQGVGVLRCGYNYMTLVLDGEGSVKIRVYPNALDTPYAHDLLPDLDFPLMSNGDAEVPIDEEASRLFVEFICQCVDSAFILSNLVMVMNTSGFAPYRGRNN